MNISDRGEGYQRSDDPPPWPAQLTFEMRLTLKMSAPCPDCDSTDGVIVTVSGQDPVSCAKCGRSCYYVLCTQTGNQQRSLRTRPDIKVRDRIRILLRDNCACAVCRRREVPLEIGHLISVRAGQALGLSEAELFSDENLAAMCESCDSGLGSDTVPLRLLVPALRARRI
jgi:5-methylcytosine-specific restriction endonuclease McrA